MLAPALYPARRVRQDYISVPQTVGLSDAAAVQDALGKQARAIRSVPSSDAFPRFRG